MPMSTEEFQTMSLPIIGGYNVQRFQQFGTEDAANWYVTKGNEGTKRQFSMYPTMGRAHISYNGVNRLIFDAQPRFIFKSINYIYVVVGDNIFQYNSSYNKVDITTNQTIEFGTNVYFAYLLFNNIVYACFVDGEFIYVYQENNPSAGLQKVTDPLAPGIAAGTKPGYIASFGNRIVVSVAGSSQFFLSVINLGGASFDPATCFGSPGAGVFATEAGIIRQFGVLKNTLYIFTDFTTGIWSNQPAVFSGTQTYFPWKKNNTFDWNYGIADSLSLDIDFGLIVFLAQNSDGLLQVMASGGGEPEVISSKAIDVLFQRYSNLYGNASPFLSGNASGFLYQYENTIFYRISGGNYTGTQILDQELNNNSIEYNFDTKTWERCIEVNGERCRIQEHVYFNNKHLVTVQGDNTVYSMSGQYYYNEITNPAQSDPQASDAYLQYPIRYERVTPIISLDDYAEFQTDYVEIDFVFGDSNIVFSPGPFPNTQFIIDEQADSSGNPVYVVGEMPDADGNPVYMITENSNYPTLSDTIYNTLYKPNVELFWSDDGGRLFLPADSLEFSQMGVYQWRMRWYQLGVSRNRVYKLVAVSPVPIVVLGAVMMVRRISGGAN